jgi:hypothetical protein
MGEIARMILFRLIVRSLLRPVFCQAPRTRRNARICALDLRVRTPAIFAPISLSMKWAVAIVENVIAFFSAKKKMIKMVV